MLDDVKIDSIGEVNLDYATVTPSARGAAARTLRLMPTRRLPDDPRRPLRQPCRHPEHDPPGHMVYRPGRYEHTCPGCGNRVTFTVTGPVWSPWLP